MTDIDVLGPLLDGRQWPIGIRYRDQFPQLPPQLAWVEFKLWSARWYLETLQQILSVTENLDRLVGVEMAIDGFLAACSSAFDSATVALILAMEDSRNVPEQRRIPAKERNWPRTKKLADTSPATVLASRGSADVALAGAGDDQPTGWLAQLRRLRNQSTHTDTLSRHFRVGGDDESTQIIVPGIGPLDPLPYFELSLRKCRDLVRLMRDDAEQVLS